MTETINQLLEHPDYINQILKNYNITKDFLIYFLVNYSRDVFNSNNEMYSGLMYEQEYTLKQIAYNMYQPIKYSYIDSQLNRYKNLYRMEKIKNILNAEN